MLQRLMFSVVPFLVAMALAVPAPVHAGTKETDAAALRAKVAREGRINIIAEMVEPATDGGTSPKAGSSPAARIAGLGVSARPLGSLPYMALEVDARQLEALLSSGAVARVGANRKVRPLLRQSVPRVRAAAAWSQGARGAGQTIVVVDTGVRSNHPFLAGRVVRSLCSAEDCGARVVDRARAGEPFAGCPPTSVVASHGTHVAGIAAGRATAFTGVAPDAKIISMRVFRCEEADWEYIIRALDYVATNLASRHKIAAVNLSLGDDVHFASACDSADATHAALAAAVRKLRRLGIATVAATGNEGIKNGVSAPACLREVIAVGSSNKNDTASWFSNSAPNVDLLAPGAAIYSSLATGRYGFLEGTSMAAPHVAGAIAVLRSKLPGASLVRIEDALKVTGRRIVDPENRIAKPRIDLGRALTRLRATPAVAARQVDPALAAAALGGE